MTSETERLDKNRGHVRTPSGPASYGGTGGPGRPVLSGHGVSSGRYLRRHASELLDGQRRCLPVDLLPRRHTPG